MKVSTGLRLAAALAVTAGLISPAMAQRPAADPARQQTIPLVSPTGKGLYIKLIDQKTLGSDRIGILEFVEPKEGDIIEAGKQIAGLKDEIVKASLAVAEKEASNNVEIRYAKAATEVAWAELEKARDANRRVRGTFPDIEVQRLQLTAEKTKLQIEQAEHQLAIALLKVEEARAALDTYRVIAPIGGIVTKVYKTKGEAVQQGEPILDMVNTDRVRVEGYVNIEAVWQVQAGDPVKLRLNIPDVDLEVEKEEFEGKVVFIDVVAEPLTQRVRVWAEVENRNNILKAGLTADAVILPTSTATASKGGKTGN